MNKNNIEVTFNQSKVEPKLNNIESKRKEIEKLQNEVKKIQSQVPSYIHQIIENAKKYDGMTITNIDFFEPGQKTIRSSRIKKKLGMKPSWIDTKSKDGFGIDFKLSRKQNDFSFDIDSFLTIDTDFHLTGIRVYKREGKVRMWFRKNSEHQSDCTCDCDVDWR